MRPLHSIGIGDSTIFNYGRENNAQAKKHNGRGAPIVQVFESAWIILEK